MFFSQFNADKARKLSEQGLKRDLDKIIKRIKFFANQGRRYIFTPNDFWSSTQNMESAILYLEEKGFTVKKDVSCIEIRW